MRRRAYGPAMDWAEQIQRHRRALIVAGISLAHGAAFAAFLTLKVTTPITAPPDPIMIEGPSSAPMEATSMTVPSTRIAHFLDMFRA